MQFFEHQESAQRNTRRLVVLFGLAVLGVMAAVHFALVAVFAYWPQADPPFEQDPWDWRLMTLSALSVLVVVSLGSLYKILLLRSGGQAVAEMLGGKRIDPARADFQRRRLLNVVEEMAIASGTPVPSVYEVDEDGINAFAAGHSLGDAVIGVTRGSLQRLTRDELQGVVAHEFSHILNGDMRLNLRLVGLVYGILVIGVIGRLVLRSVFPGSSGSRNGKDKKLFPPILAFGAALAAIGFVGTLFGNLIKAAISRQREFLADASAVQYTRNPGGIAGALKKIGGLEKGSRMSSPAVEEVSHMLFGMGFSGWRAWLYATHPPLAERVGRIDPSFDGTFPVLKGRPDQGEIEPSKPLPADTGLIGLAAREGSKPGQQPSALNLAGRPMQEHIQYALQLVKRLPECVRSAAEEPFGARAVIYSLLLDEGDELRKIQLEGLARSADPDVFRETIDLEPHVRRLDARMRLPLVGVAVAALREMSGGQYQAFKQNVARLIKEDQKLSLFEWALGRIVLSHLDPQFSKSKSTAIRYRPQKQIGRHCSLLLSRLAYQGHPQVDQAVQAFQAGVGCLAVRGLHFLPRQECSFAAMDKALDALRFAAPRLISRFLQACAETIAHDKRITVEEGELFRAIADSLGCPVPPLLKGQRLA